MHRWHTEQAKVGTMWTEVANINIVKAQKAFLLAALTETGQKFSTNRPLQTQLQDLPVV